MGWDRLVKFDGSNSFRLSGIDGDKKRLLQLLALRKDKRYRKGIIQCAFSFDIIDNLEHSTLKTQIENGIQCFLYFNK